MPVRKVGRRRYKPVRRVGRGWLARKRAKRGMGDSKRFFKLRLVSSISTDGSGVASFSATDLPSSAQDWSSVAALFDQYRVCAMKLKFIPHAFSDVIGSQTITNNLTATATVTTGSQASNQTYYSPFYIVHDPDSTVATVADTVNEAIEYENMKVFDLHRPFQYYRKMAKQFRINSDVSTDIKGYQSTATPQATQIIAGVGTGFTISVEIGKVIVTYYIAAKARK